MFFLMRLVILFYLTISLTEFVNGMNCFEAAAQNACKCSDQTGSIGTCTCTTTSVRHNQPCAKFNGVDSVSFKIF
jgi:hypothetical protein